MTRFTLVLKPNGKALLVTPDRLDPGMMEHLRRLWSEWRNGHQDILFVSDTDVRLVEDIELDLGGTDGAEERRGSRREARRRQGNDQPS